MGNCFIISKCEYLWKKMTVNLSQLGPSSHLYVPVSSCMIYGLIYSRLLYTQIIFLCS